MALMFENDLMYMYIAEVHGEAYPLVQLQVTLSWIEGSAFKTSILTGL